MNLDERLHSARREYLDRPWPAPSILGDTPGRSPQRHRWARIGVLVAGCLILVVIGVVAVRRPFPGDGVVAGPNASGMSAPAGAADGALTEGLVSALPEPAMPQVPAGWKLIDYSDFRFAVPGDWQVAISRSCWQPAGDPTPTGVVLLQSSPTDGQATCHPEHPLPASVLSLVGGQRSAFSGQATTVGTFNAVRSIGPSCTPPSCPNNQYLFDDGYVLSFTGPLEEQVLATFTASGRDRALLGGPVADRAGWKPISTGGVTVEVPPSWTTLDLPASYQEVRDPDGSISSFGGHINPGDCDGVYFRSRQGGQPTAYLGSSPFMKSCPPSTFRDLTPADGVWIRPADQNRPASRPADRSVQVGAVTVTLLTTSNQLTVPVIDLEVKTHDATVLVSIGVGADPSVARSILRSVSSV